MISAAILSLALVAHPPSKGWVRHQHALADQQAQSQQWRDRRDGYNSWAYGQQQAQQAQQPREGVSSGSPGFWGPSGITDAMGNPIKVFFWAPQSTLIFPR